MHHEKDIVPESKELPEMLKHLENGFYAIPVFQREFVWDLNNIKSLWDSIYRHYPIGSFLIWETDEKLPRHKKLFDIELKSNEKGKYTYILDGQQRITSLLGSVRGAKRKTNKTFTLYFDVKKAFEFQGKDSPDLGEIQFFLDEDEFNDLIDEEKQYAVPVSSLIEFNTDFWRKLDRAGHENIADFYKNVCDRLRSKYKISIIRLNKMPIDEVCEIFTRVNQRGKKLTLVELMTAKTFKGREGEDDGFFLRDILDELNDDIEKYMRGYKDTIDETIFLRIISINHKGTCREKDLLMLNAETINKLWAVSVEGYKKAIIYMKDEINIDSPVILPYPPMLIPLAYFFTKLNKRPLTETLKKIINLWFWVNSFSASYQGATNEKIKQDCEWFNRVVEGETKLNTKLSKRIELDDIINQELILSNAFCKSILCVLNNLQPRDFRDHNRVQINQLLIKNKKDELHHIFPIKSDIGRRYKGSLVNSIANIAFLPKDTNNYIRNKSPKEYLSEFRKSNEHFDKDVDTHLIPLNESMNNDFERFIKKRAEFIRTRIYELTGIASDIEQRIKEKPDELWNEYELEIRSKLDKLLSSKHGLNYWNDKKTIPEHIRTNIDERVKKELKIRPDIKEYLFTSRAKLDYCDVMDYEAIIQTNWDIFEEYFGSKEETKLNFKNLQIFRNTIKHAKNLDELTRKKGELSLLWLKNMLKLGDQQEGNIDFTPIDEIYDRLTKEILSLGNDIIKEQKKYYTAFKVKNNNFVCTQLQNSNVKMWFSVSQGNLNDQRKMAKDVSGIGHHGTGNFEIKLNSGEDLSYVLSLIKQSYEFSKKQSSEYNLSYHLSKVKDFVTKERITQIIKMIKDIDKSIQDTYSKYYINFQKNRAFCAIYCQKNQFWLDLKLPESEIKDLPVKVRNNKDKIWKHIRVDNKIKLNILIPYVKKAFEQN